MKERWFVLAACGAVLLSGCGGREEEMKQQFEKEKAGLMASTDSLVKVIDQRDRYFDEVVRSINDVYTNLAAVREKERMITQEAGETEGKFSPTNEQARTELLKQIADIGSTLDENKKKIAGLQSKIKKMNKEFASLTETVQNLEKMLAERERTIAQLEGRVQGLEGEVVERDRLIAERDAFIGSQETSLNTVYYITGTRAELEEKGIIRDEGGFPFGWFGSTTVLASGIDKSAFSTLDMRKDQVIHVPAEIDEIVPGRDASYYSMNLTGEAASDITITDPGRFWQEKYLVIITD
jgi:uncharacterized protein YoxC